jgi:hypothetical protein
MVEPDRQQTLSGHMLDTTMAAPHAQVLVQVADRLDQPSVMGGQHRPAGRHIPQAVQDRDALGRPQDHIKGRHGVAAVGAAQQLAGGGVAAFEHGLEPGHRCFALQAEGGGAGAVPPPWGLAVARQILLVVGGQLTGVILLPTHRQLGDVSHHPAAPLPALVGASNAPLVHCSPRTNFGSSVERAAHGQVLWRVQIRTAERLLGQLGWWVGSQEDGCCLQGSSLIRV